MRRNLLLFLFLLTAWNAWAQTGQLTSLPMPQTLPAPAFRPSVENRSARQMAPAAMTIRYVKAGASGTGVSWSNASGDLQAMINASATGDQVWIAGGTYKPSTAGLSNARDAAFSLKNGVSVLGGFAGTAGTEGNGSARTAIPSSTTLSGDIGTAGDNTDNTYHVFNHSANSINSTAVLDGSVITGGNANGDVNTGVGRGGGMFNPFGSIPAVTNCLFIQNSAAAGGAMDNEGASFILTNCSFINNSAVYGAGVYAPSSSGTLVNCYFYQNTASILGGGVAFTSTASTGNLTNCTFRNNSSLNGGALLTEANITLTNCITWSNGGQNSLIINNTGGYSASYSLIESGETDYSNGGNNQTLTTSPFDNANGPALKACAAAVDAGNDAANTTTTDALGNARKMRTIDIGAAEFQGTSTQPVTIISQTQSASVVCAGAVVDFFVTYSGTGPVTIAFFQDNTKLSENTVASPARFGASVNVTQSHTYRFAITSACNSVTTSPASVTANPLPTQFTVVGSGAGCADAIGTGIALNGSQVGVSYQLLRNNVAVGNPVDGNGGGYLSLGVQNVAGTYTVRATDKSTFCQQLMSGSAVYTVYALPTQYAVTGGGAYCADGDGVLVGLSGSQTGIAYQLIRAGNNIGDFITGTGQAISFGRQTGAGTYTVRARDLSRGCQQDMTGSATVTVNQLVTITSQSQSVSAVCGAISNTAAFQFGIAVSGTGPYSFALFRDGSVENKIGPLAFDNIIFTPINRQSGNYQIVVTTACNSVTTTFAPVTVNALPTQYSATGGGNICVGDAGVTVGLAGSQTGVNYQLLRGTTPVGNPVAGTGSAISFGNQATAGTYVVRASNPTTSCQQDMIGSATVTVNPKPVVTVVQPTAICQSNTVDLTKAVSSDISATFAFFTDAQLTRPVANPAAVSVGGTYYARATTPAGCTSNGVSISVTVYALPAVSITGLDNAYCKDAVAVTLAPLGSPQGGSFTVNGNAATEFAPTSLTVGEHTVVYRYVDTNGCPNSATKKVTVKTTPPAPSLLTQQGGTYPGGQSSVTVDVNSGSVNLVVSGCSGMINWTGSNNMAGSNSPIAVATNLPGRFVYQATCTVDGCTSPIASATVTVQGRLTVLLRDVDNYVDNNAIQPLLVLQNQGITALPYSKLTLRYYLTVEGSSPLSNLSVNYAQVGNQNVRLRYVAPQQAGGQGYVEVGFTEGAGSLAAGASSGAIQSYFAKSDYSALNERDDYSYAPVRDQLLGTLRVTAYYDGVLIAGIEPGSTAIIRAVRALTESKNGPSATQINTFLEVRNEGNVPINYSDLKIRYYFTSDGNERLLTEIDEGQVRGQLVKLSPALNRADTYLELSFIQGGQLAPGASTGTIRYRISKPDGGRFDQSNDYSYQEQPQDRSQNSRVTVYVGQERLWGTEPGAGARLAADVEPGTGLAVRLLGNPIIGGVVEADVTGVAGQFLRVQLTDLQGRTVATHQVESAAAIERIKLPVNQSAAGMLLLQVNTPTQSQSIKVLKME